MIPSVNDTEIRKQLSKMGRNKTCELDNLLIEEIIMVAELNLLLKDYTTLFVLFDHPYCLLCFISVCFYLFVLIFYHIFHFGWLMQMP